jgi:hypothetical protein
LTTCSAEALFLLLELGLLLLLFFFFSSFSSRSLRPGGFSSGKAFCSFSGASLVSSARPRPAFGFLVGSDSSFGSGFGSSAGLVLEQARPSIRGGSRFDVGAHAFDEASSSMRSSNPVGRWVRAATSDQVEQLRRRDPQEKRDLVSRGMPWET